MAMDEGGGFGGCGGGQEVLDVWSWLARLGSRSRPCSDSFFSDGDAACAQRAPVYLTQLDHENLLHQDFKEFPCSVPGCQAVGATFTQLHEYEAHYNALHRHSCATCGKSLPSAYLLELHITESHDSFFAVMSKKKASFECFLEKCSRKFWTHEERRDHGVQAHQFPTDFTFDEARRESLSHEDEDNNNASGRHDDEAMEQDEVQLRHPSTKVRSPRKMSSSTTTSGSSSTMSSSTLSPRHSITSAQSHYSKTPPLKRSKLSRHSVTGPSSSRSQASGSPVLRSKRPNDPPRVRPKSVMLTPSRIPSPTKATPKTPPANEPVARRRFSLASVIGEPTARKSLSPPTPRRPQSHTPQSLAGGIALKEAKERRGRICDSSVELSRKFSEEDEENGNNRAQGSPRRAPFSLSRMGERAPISQSTHDVMSSPDETKDSPTSSSSPSKSRSKIPVLRSISCKVPETLSFGAGVPKAFQKPDDSSPYWHSRNYASTGCSGEQRYRGGSRKEDADNEQQRARLAAFEIEMMDALPL